MFVRSKTIRANGRTYQYLHIVENRWEKGKVRQRIVGSLGRLDSLLESGDLEQVITQLVERCPTVKLLRAQAAGALELESDRVWGPVLVFGRLWEELGLKASELLDLRCLGLVYGEEVGVFQLVCLARVKSGLAELEARECSGSWERSELIAAPTEALTLARWILENKDRLTVAGRSGLVMEGMRRWGEPWSEGLLA